MSRNIYSLRRKLQLSNAGMRILAYHSIGGSAYNDKLDLFSLQTELFRQQVNFMSNHSDINNVPLSPMTLDDKLNVSVTFDDGYLDNLSVAAPLLIEKNIPFTVFVTSNFIKNRIKGFLSPTDLRELSTLPQVQIGSHGANHLCLADCDNITLKDELCDSKKYLEDITGQSIATIAYPHGSVNNNVNKKCEKYGYNIGVSSEFGINRKNIDCLMLKRTTILSGDTNDIFKIKIFGGWDWYGTIKHLIS